MLARPLSDAERIENAYVAAFARSPEAWEKDAALQFLAEQANRHGEDQAGEAAWTAYIQTS